MNRRIKQFYNMMINQDIPSDNQAARCFYHSYFILKKCFQIDNEFVPKIYPYYYEDDLQVDFTTDMTRKIDYE